MMIPGLLIQPLTLYFSHSQRVCAIRPHFSDCSLSLHQITHPRRSPYFCSGLQFDGVSKLSPITYLNFTKIRRYPRLQGLQQQTLGIHSFFQSVCLPSLNCATFPFTLNESSTVHFLAMPNCRSIAKTLLVKYRVSPSH